jgi:hypothetical protein
MTTNPRLANLLDLADKGPALRAALAEEAAALLMEWPDDCPPEMRPVFENLLAKTAREVDTPTRARLRVRLYADRALCARVLPREDAITPLICAARAGDAVVPRLAQTLGLDEDRATLILNEDTGEALAIACKGAGLSRAAYSTLALLAFPRDGMADRLSAFDRVATLDAARTLRAWRGAQLPQTAAE